MTPLLQTHHAADQWGIVTLNFFYYARSRGCSTDVVLVTGNVFLHCKVPSLGVERVRYPIAANKYFIKACNPGYEDFSRHPRFLVSHPFHWKMFFTDVAKAAWTLNFSNNGGFWNHRLYSHIAPQFMFFPPTHNIFSGRAQKKSPAWHNDP